MLAQRGDEPLTVASEFGLAYPGQVGELIEVERHVLCHLTQRGVMKNDIRRQAILVRQALA
jgi:hypothetical protein